MVADKVKIYLLVGVELKKILAWCKSPNQQESFDLDFAYSSLFQKHNVSMDYGVLYPIFSLVDTMCDSIRHNNPYITSDYTVDEGIQDLETIIHLIDDGKIVSLEDDVKLIKKLNRLYRLE